MKRNINWTKVAAYLIYYIVGSIVILAIILSIFALPELLLHIIGYGIY